MVGVDDPGVRVRQNKGFAGGSEDLLVEITHFLRGGFGACEFSHVLNQQDPESILSFRRRQFFQSHAKSVAGVIPPKAHNAGAALLVFK